jgi:uncharacterized membrane protein YeaQ/YmgE (transglycosylase-associated protein family)
MVGEIIGAILLGLVAGYIAKALLPGDDPGGFLATTAIGIAGSLVGYFLFTALLGIGDDDKFDFGGIIGAIIGTMLLLLAYRLLVRGREHQPATAGGPSLRGGRRRRRRERV